MLETHECSLVAARIYVHLSWTTLRRLPLITPPVAAFLDRFLRQESRRQGSHPYALGVVLDHVHMILELPPVYDIPRLVQGLKGASARLANRDGHAAHRPLQWAAGYDLRSIGVRQLASAVRYVERQDERHPERVVGGES